MSTISERLAEIERAQDFEDIDDLVAALGAVVAEIDEWTASGPAEARMLATLIRSRLTRALGAEA